MGAIILTIVVGTAIGRCDNGPIMYEPVSSPCAQGWAEAPDYNDS